MCMSLPHAQPPIQAAPTNPHFDRIGGQVVIDQLVDTFYRLMDTLPQASVIRAMHEPDLTQTKAILKAYLAEWMGGPKAYSAQKGHPRLRMRHASFAIGVAERDAWMLCMRGALEETVSDAGLREQLTQAFFKTADFIRNDSNAGHAHR